MKKKIGALLLAVLMLLTLCINLAAVLVERHFRRKRSL